MKIILATSRKWNEGMVDELHRRLKSEVVLVTNSEELKQAVSKTTPPDYIFFPHWSSILKSEIYDSFQCVMFHMTDLPFGRGGSPLQNLIDREISETKISAFRCEKGMDTGPIYLKKPLTLEGPAHQIFKRASDVILEMMIEIVERKLTPVSQTGEPTLFERRKPEQSDLQPVKDLKKAYDLIRMLDAEGYPHAFLQNESLMFEFTDAQFSTELGADEIVAKVRIKRK